MTYDNLLSRVSVDPKVCGGKPCIQGTRIYIAIILGGLAEGLTPEELLDHYPQLTLDDIHAAEIFQNKTPVRFDQEKIHDSKERA